MTPDTFLFLLQLLGNITRPHCSCILQDTLTLKLTTRSRLLCVVNDRVNLSWLIVCELYSYLRNYYRECPSSRRHCTMFVDHGDKHYLPSWHLVYIYISDWSHQSTIARLFNALYHHYPCYIRSWHCVCLCNPFQWPRSPRA